MNEDRKSRKEQPSKLRQMFGSRFKAGSYSAFAAAVVIAIAVLANLAVQALPQTAPPDRP